ncbi:hypothetical protein CR513_10349, partial [Mucuna pruriens]
MRIMTLEVDISIQVMVEITLLICGHANHSIDICYYKHGFSPKFKLRTPRIVNLTCALDNNL